VGLSLVVSHLSSAVLSLLVALGMGLLGVAVGERLLERLGSQPGTGGERSVLAGGLGLGALGYGFLALGLVGLLRPIAIWAMLALAAVWAWPQIRRWPARWRDARPSLRPPDMFNRLAITLVVVMLAIVLLRGLAPVTDYDGLAYHLVVPREYLRAGRIVPFPGNAHFNFPLTVDLLYIPAILLGLENAARLIHLGFGVLMGMGVYTLAERCLGSRKQAWLAVLVLSTTPLIGTVGGYAHTDLGWALFEFLAAYALLCFLDGEGKSWLVLAGVFAGLGLGSKYLGIAVLGVLGLVLIAQSILARSSWRRILGDGLYLGLIALAVASPWYLRNWLQLGNPFYPLWFGGRGWDAFQSFKLAFMGTSYGPRRGLLGILLLPWDLFRYSIGYFGPIPFAFPTPLCFVLPLYMVGRRRRVINLILLISVLRFGTWAVSARSPRYLMDIYPLLCIPVAYLLAEMARRRWLGVLVRLTVFSLLVLNLVWQVSLLIQEDPIPVVLGLERVEDYLVEHNHPPYKAIQFINHLPSDSRVLFVGNGQSYYATVDHVADVNHDNWGHLIYLWGEEPFQLHRALMAQGITHIYYSDYDFVWQRNFDFDGHLAHELALFDLFAARCARLTYDDGENGQVFALLEQCAD
jgi:4-amino-4-deoxy-L-arabinose transferase-like glycosyltransferase